MPGVAVGTILTYMSYAAMAYSIFTAATMSSPKKIKERDAGVLANTKQISAVLPLVYGKGRVGGNIIYTSTEGSDNKYLHMILTLGEGEINGLATVDGIHPTTFNPYSCDGIYLNGELYILSKYKDHFYYEFFSGSPIQTVCSTLHSAKNDWTDPLRNTAYLYCRFTYNRDNPLPLPTVTALLEGLNVRDFSTEDDHDSMPMLYTNNIAYCAYDLLTRPSSRGGKGLDSTRIDLTSFREAADYYDSYGWTCNMAVSDDNSIEDNLESLLTNGRSNLVYSNSKFMLKFRDTREEVVCYQITEDDIIQTGKYNSLAIKPAAKLFDRPNSVNASFFNAEKNYHKDEKVYTDSEAYSTEGDYRELKIDLLGLSLLETVIPMSYYYLERARWGNTVTMTIGNQGIVLEPMDLVEITATMPGWTDDSKPLYRVESAVLQSDGNTVLTLLQENDDLYNDDYDISTQKLFYTSLLGPGSNVPGVINLSHDEEVYYYRDKSFTRWTVNFDPPPIEEYPFWDYAEIWMTIGSGTYKYMTNARSDYMIDPVEEGVKYGLKIRSVSTFGTKEDFDSACLVTKMIRGKTDAPSNMDSITISVVDDTVNAYGTPISDPDLVGYEFRISDQLISGWGGAVYLGFNKLPSWSISGMRAGNYRIFCAPINDSGKYSGDKVHADFVIQEPKGYTVYDTVDIDYPTGSHNNTEFVDLGGAAGYSVRVTHTGGLEGTYTTPVIDVGEVRHLRVQGDFVLYVLDADNIWKAFWPNPATWDSLDVNARWNTLYGTDVASKIEAKLKWGVAAADEFETDKFELMSVDTEGRYYQVEIKLTDPNHEQYILLSGSGGNTVLTLTLLR